MAHGVVFEVTGECVRERLSEIVEYLVQLWQKLGGLFVSANVHVMFDVVFVP